MSSRATSLILVRHANSACCRDRRPLMCGWHDIPLSASGRAQVDRLRQRLAGHAVAAVYSSTLKRALETSDAARDGIPRDVRQLRSLTEIRCGLVDGWPLDDVQDRYPELWARNFAQSDETFRWPGGESYAGFRRRVLRAVRTIAERHPGEEVLLFTHAGVISQVIGWIRGYSAAEWAPCRPGNASITRVVSDGPRWAVETFDDRTHLQ